MLANMAAEVCRINKSITFTIRKFTSIHSESVPSWSKASAYSYTEKKKIKTTSRCGWLVVLGFNAALTAKVISWRSVTHMFPGFLTPVLTLLFFPKPPTTHTLHESDTLTTEPPGRGTSRCGCESRQGNNMVSTDLQSVYLYVY